MKALLSTILTVIVFISCAQTPNNNSKIQRAEKRSASSNEAIATFAEGCFWHTEIVFQSLVGVRDAVSGYAGGHTSNPTYQSVSTGQTGHAEAVQVFYDPSKISYETLVAAFFASHDPTTIDRQGNDVGTEYRSIAFYRNDKEKQAIMAEINKLHSGKKYASSIVTQVVPFTKFYPAEDYHQEYISNNPGNSYVQNVSIPDYMHFRKVFKGNFKP